MYEAMQMIRAMSDGEVQRFGLQSRTVSMMLLCGPDALDSPGLGDLSPKIDAVFATTKDDAGRNRKIDEVRPIQDLW